MAESFESLREWINSIDDRLELVMGDSGIHPLEHVSAAYINGLKFRPSQNGRYDSEPLDARSG